MLVYFDCIIECQPLFFNINGKKRKGVSPFSFSRTTFGDQPLIFVQPIHIGTKPTEQVR